MNGNKGKFAGPMTKYPHIPRHGGVQRERLIYIYSQGTGYYQKGTSTVLGAGRFRREKKSDA